jgi:hypothetical protein
MRTYENEKKKSEKRVLPTHTLHEVDDALSPVRHLELGASEACMRSKRNKKAHVCVCGMLLPKGIRRNENVQFEEVQLIVQCNIRTTLLENNFVAAASCCVLLTIPLDCCSRCRRKGVHR